MIAIVAKFIVKEGQEEKFLSLAKELCPASRAEKGCIEYILHKNADKKRTYCFIEKWQDQAAIDEHSSTTHFTTIVPQITAVAEAEVDVYQPI